MMVVWPWGWIYNLKCIVLQLSTWVCLKIGVSDFGTPKNIEIVEFTRKPVLIRTPPPNIALASKRERAKRKVSAFTCSVQYNDLQLCWNRLSNSYRQIVNWLDSRFQQVASFTNGEDFAQQLREWPTEKLEPQRFIFFLLKPVTSGFHRFPTQDMQPVEVHKPYRWPRRPWLLAEAMS